jgi:hypothetical protein
MKSTAAPSQSSPLPAPLALRSSCGVIVKRYPRGSVARYVSPPPPAPQAMSLLYAAPATDPQCLCSNNKRQAARRPLLHCHPPPQTAHGDGEGGRPSELNAPTAASIRSASFVARMLPIGPGGLQSGFSALRYVRRDFRKNKTGSADSPPPRSPPVLGSLVWRAQGLPSTRNWPFRWPLSPTSPPQVIPKAM